MTYNRYLSLCSTNRFSNIKGFRDNLNDDSLSRIEESELGVLEFLSAGSFDACTYYYLLDPRDEKVRYVGATFQALEERVDGHRAKCKNCSTKKERWLKNILDEELKIIYQKISTRLIPNFLSISKEEIKNKIEKEYVIFAEEEGYNLMNSTNNSRLSPPTLREYWSVLERFLRTEKRKIILRGLEMKDINRIRTLFKWHFDEDIFEIEAMVSCKRNYEVAIRYMKSMYKKSRKIILEDRKEEDKENKKIESKWKYLLGMIPRIKDTQSILISGLDCTEKSGLRAYLYRHYDDKEIDVVSRNATTKRFNSEYKVKISKSVNFQDRPQPNVPENGVGPVDTPEHVSYDVYVLPNHSADNRLRSISYSSLQNIIDEFKCPDSEKITLRSVKKYHVSQIRSCLQRHFESECFEVKDSHRGGGYYRVNILKST